MLDPYKVLGISQDANEQEIKKAYRALSRKYHPDVNINKPLKEREEAEQRFKELIDAYAIVSDPEKRAKYDLKHNLQFTFSENNFETAYRSYQARSQILYKKMVQYEQKMQESIAFREDTRRELDEMEEQEFGWEEPHLKKKKKKRRIFF